MKTARHFYLFLFIVFQFSSQASNISTNLDLDSMPYYLDLNLSDNSEIVFFLSPDLFFFFFFLQSLLH